MRELIFTAFLAVSFNAQAQAPARPEPLQSHPLPAIQMALPQPPPTGPVIPQTKKEILLKALPDDLQRELWLADYPDLDRAEKDGRLIPVRDGPEVGFILRRTGKWFIGEREKRSKYREKLYRLSKPAAGLLYMLAARLKEGLGSEFVPLDITSLVRTARYQKSLARVNGNAQVKKIGIPPTHVLGLAFDIAWAKMPKEEIKLLLEILDGLSSEKKVVYFLEGATAAALHVVALPSAHEEFARYYDKAITLTPVVNAAAR